MVSCIDTNNVWCNNYKGGEGQLRDRKKKYSGQNVGKFYIPVKGPQTKYFVVLNNNDFEKSLLREQDEKEYKPNQN